MMKSTIAFKSKHNNHYLYDFNYSLVLLLHPFLYAVMEEGANSAETNIAAKAYYRKKYLFLKNNGWFREYPFVKKVSRLLTEQDVTTQIANTEQLTFEVTESCNLNCSYCGYGELYKHHENRSYKNLDFETAVPIIDYCFSLWNSERNKSKEKKIYIGFYSGEPLLNFKIIEQIVCYVKNKDIYKRIHFAMTTNSMLLDKYTDFLVKHKFHLLLSLDGNSSNNAYRKKKNGDSSFKEVCSNIDKLYKLYPSYFKQYVNFNAVLHNANSVDDIYGFIKGRYNKIPQLSELNTFGIAEEKKDKFNRMFLNYERSILSSANKQEIVDQLFISIPFFKDLSRFVLQHLDVRKELQDLTKRSNTIHTPTGTCTPFAKKIFVSVSGNLFPCETIQRNYPLGNVRNGEVELNFMQVTDYYNNIYLCIRKQCEICYLQRSCVQCIFNMPTQYSRPSCETSMNKTKFTNYLSDNLSNLEDNSVFLKKIVSQIYLK